MTKENKSGGGISLATKSRWRTPEHFFPVIVDNFFDDPEGVMNYGKALPKASDPAGMWPGERSDFLWEIDQTMQNAIISKVLNCYFNLEYVDISWNSSSINFQEIPRFSENKNDIRNKSSYIHQDLYEDFELAGVVYLTPNIDPESGTSLYNIKSTKSSSKDDLHIFDEEKQDTFTEFFKGGQFDIEEYTKNMKTHEEKFVETLRVSNIFNRILMYDTCEWHRANSYYNSDGEDARFHLGFFLGGLSVHPLKRIKNNECEYIIQDRLQFEKKNRIEQTIGHSVVNNPNPHTHSHIH
jgi:hypothetical protein